jgi:predicted O-linked N-acetylglucosamine transferase (SPINDLY family)
VTFGCLNNYAKVSKPALTAWTELLRRVPRSRLILHCPRGSHWQRIEDWVASRGVERERIKLVATMPLEEYFHLYDRIDIALDPFPYAGGTTTCDALWMGVPVVSLAGKTAVSRGGLSILSNVGLADLVTSDVEQYVQTASRLSHDLPRLADLRTTLRQRMSPSSLTDARAFAKDMEAIYRCIWRRWRESAP